MAGDGRQSYYADIENFLPSRMLRLAAEMGDLAVVRRLIEDDGVDPDERDGDDSTRTALIAAAAAGHICVVDYLIKAGADIGAYSWDYHRERCERSAIHVAADKGRVAVVELLLATDKELIDARDGAGDLALRYAARSGQVSILHLLIETHGQHVDTPGRNGVTALMYAAGAGQKKAVDYLISLGCDVSLRADEGYFEGGGWTAVHFACRSGQLDIVEMLLAKDASLHDAKTADGRTLLHWAARYNVWPLVSYLVEHHNHDVNRRGYNGRTPLMEAASAGSDKLVEYLLEKGADLSARSDDQHTQMTALCFCFQSGDHLSTANLLLSKGATLPIHLYNYLLMLSPAITDAQNLEMMLMEEDENLSLEIHQREPGYC